MTDTIILALLLTGSHLVFFWIGKESLRRRQIAELFEVTDAYWDKVQKADKETTDAKEFLLKASEANLELQLEFGNIVFSRPVLKGKEDGA